jgi:hypothetical protein
MAKAAGSSARMGRCCVKCEKRTVRKGLRLFINRELNDYVHEIQKGCATANKIRYEAS